MKYRIDTITRCHIGTGTKLIENVDFISSKGVVGILSSEKIYALLGDRGVDLWCLAIERKRNLWQDVILTQKPNTRPEEVCSRVIARYGESCRELSEQIASNGTPYIPGSSLKGAIVSALVGTYREQIKLPYEIRSKNNIVGEQIFVQPEEKNGRTKYEPTNSLLRLLRVGDAYFKPEHLVAVECYGLNLREQDPIIDKDTKMLIECLECEATATVDIQLLSAFHDTCRRIMPPLPEAMQSEEQLLVAINNHTKRLLNEELKFWKSQKGRRYYHIDSEQEQKEFDEYIGYIEALRDLTDECQAGSEALLRVGYGSGWRFMTGGWIDDTHRQWQQVVAAARPNQYRYDQYDFPKTRRIGAAPPFGFVQLTKL